MGSVENRVHAFGRIIRSYASGVVVAVAGARRDEDAIRLVPVQRNRRTICGGEVVVAVTLRTIEPARRSLREVVAVAGLVVNDGDDAGSVSAERVLGGSIGDTTGRQRRDSGRSAVGRALYLVELAGVVIVQGASGAYPTSRVS